MQRCNDEELRGSALDFSLRRCRLPHKSRTQDLGGDLEYLFSSTYDSPNRKLYRPSPSRAPQRQMGSDRIRYRSYGTEIRGYFGGSVENTPNFADQLKNRLGYGTLDATLWSDHNSIGYGEVDRFYMNWARKDFQFTVGRQRIAWGTNLVWNVIDMFNPLSVLDFDYVERPAADAVQVQYYTSPVTKLAFAYKPTTIYSKSITGFLWTLNRWDYDFHFVGGERYGPAYVGGRLAGDIAGGGFRGEALLSDKPESNTGASSGRAMGIGGVVRRLHVCKFILHSYRVVV